MVNQRVIVSGFGGPEYLRVIEEEVPRPGVGEVRVRVLAAGVSFADLLMREGGHPERRRPPFTLGWDVVGRVDALGEKVRGFHEGQTVAALPIRGGYSRFLCLPDGRAVKLYSIQMRKRRHPKDFLHDLGRLLMLLGKGEISPVVARRFDLQNAAAAHELLARKAFCRKIVLTDPDLLTSRTMANA